MTLATPTLGPCPVDHVNVIDGDFTRRRNRVKSPPVVWSRLVCQAAGAEG